MNIKLDNEFLALFIPEHTQFKKDEYLDELKTYIFQIMTYTINDLVQENINLSDGNVNLNVKLKNYLEEKLDLILEVNETFIDTSNKLEIMLNLLEEIKSTLITNSFDDEKISKIKILYDKTNQIKSLMDSNTFLLLEIPGILFKCIQNENYSLYLEYYTFVNNYFAEIANEKATNVDDISYNSSNIFINKLKDKVDKVSTYCTNFLLNKFKITNNEFIFNIEIYDIVNRRIDFKMVELEKFNFLKTENDIKICKLLILLIYKVQCYFNKINKNNSNSTELDQRLSLLDKFSKDFRFKLKNIEEFLYYTISLFGCFTFKLNELVKELNVMDNQDNDLKKSILSSIKENVIKPYFFDPLRQYLDVNNKRIGFEEKFKFSFNTSEHFFNENNHVIMMIKQKFLFMSNILEKINLNNEKNSNFLGFQDFDLYDEVNMTFSGYLLVIALSILKTDSLMKYIHYNRGDTNKLIKIEENSKNEFINLVILNLGFVKDLLSEVRINLTKSILTKLMISIEGYIKSSIDIFNKYLIDNSFYVKITKESVKNMEHLNSFKKLMIFEIHEIYSSILKELDLDEKIGKRFINSLEDFLS